MIYEKTNTLPIHTPEGISFTLKLASPVTRFLAWSIDLAAIFAVISIINPLFNILGIISYDFASAFSMLVYFIVSIGYGILLEWRWQGQTLGKKILKLRVLDEQGFRLQFSQIVVRNLLRFVDALPVLYLIGGLVSLISPKAQRLGDIAANTIVVWTPAIFEPDVEHLLSDKYNSLRGYPHLEARLRQHVSSREAGIALQALMRRDELEPLARIELFKDIAAHFKTIVKFPQEATDGISDEQYIRNVVDIIFSKNNK